MRGRTHPSGTAISRTASDEHLFSISQSKPVDKEQRMDGRNALDKQIEALDEIDRQDGDIAAVSDALRIPESDLRDWLRDEEGLRRVYGLRRQRQVDRLAVDLQHDMLTRAKEMLQLMQGEKLTKAPLNQLASAAGSLVSYALKLADAIEEIDETQEKDRVVQFVYGSRGLAQQAPPWADNREEAWRAIQGGGLRPALGQDRTGQNGHSGARDLGEAADLVAGADAANGGPGLA